MWCRVGGLVKLPNDWPLRRTGRVSCRSSKWLLPLVSQIVLLSLPGWAGLALGSWPDGGDLADMLSEFWVVVLGNPLLDFCGTVSCGKCGWSQGFGGLDNCAEREEVATASKRRRSWGRLWVQGGLRERGWETAPGRELVGPHAGVAWRKGVGIVKVVLAGRMPAASWVRIWLWPSGLAGMVALLVPQVLVVMD